MSTPLDFGNGIIAHFDGLPGLMRAEHGFIEKGHYGFTSPTVDINVIENGIGDGGTIGTIRATTRKMRCTVTHNALWTRRQIQQAFTSKVLRTLSTDLASMPYYVEELAFPDSLSESRYKFTVTLVSPLAYPEGELHQLSDTQAVTYDYTTTTFATGTTKTPPAAFSVYTCMVGQTFSATIGQKIGSNTGLKVNVLTAGASITKRLYRVGASINDLTLVAEDISAYGSGVRYLTMPVDVVAAGSETYLMVAVYDSRYVTAYRDTSAGAATGVGYHYTSGAWVAGDGTDATIDWAHRFELGDEAASTTSVLLTPDTDVPCPPKVTITLGSSASSLALSDGVRTCTITGAMDASDVVVIDSAARTVTVDGVNRIAWFDRDGDWPMIDPATPSLSVDVASVLAVEWRPRLMGLI